MPDKTDLEELFYTIAPKIRRGLDDRATAVDEVLKTHLLTEVILEEIIRVVFGFNAEAILHVDLRYAQKLDLCARLELKNEGQVLPSDVVGSLRKLNSLRNGVAHELDYKVADEDVEELFVGRIGSDRDGKALRGSVSDKLRSYQAGIYIHMLKPDVIDE